MFFGFARKISLADQIFPSQIFHPSYNCRKARKLLVQAQNGYIFFFVFSHTGRLGPKFKKQLGRTKSIRFGVIPVPVGIFLEMTAQGTAELSVSLNKAIL